MKVWEYCFYFLVLLLTPLYLFYFYFFTEGRTVWVWCYRRKLFNCYWHMHNYRLYAYCSSHSKVGFWVSYMFVTLLLQWSKCSVNYHNSRSVLCSLRGIMLLSCDLSSRTLSVMKVGTATSTTTYTKEYLTCMPWKTSFITFAWHHTSMHFAHPSQLCYNMIWMFSECIRTFWFSEIHS